MKANHDLSGLIRFLSRDDWAFHFEEVMGGHFWAAMDEFDLENDEIGEALLLQEIASARVISRRLPEFSRKPSKPATVKRYRTNVRCVSE